MFGVHVISVYLLAVGLLTLLLLVLVWQRQRSGKTIVVWLTSAVTGILLGGVGSVAIVCLAGYRVDIVHGTPEIFPSAPVPGTDEVATDDMSGMGMPGMGGPGMGRGRPPSPKGDLTTLVRKIDLLTGDVGLTLSDEQVGSLLGCLADVETAETMSDDDAQAKHDEILALLDEDQQSRLDAIGLPRRRPGGSGGPGGPGGGGMGGPGGPGGGEQAEDANPFQQESNAEALTQLRERFGAQEEPAEAKPAEAKPAEAKPAEVKPAEAKPAEVKSPEVKPVEAKPAEPKPSEAKPAEAKPAEPKPAE